MNARTRLWATAIAGTIAAAALTAWLVLPRERLLEDLSRPVIALPSDSAASVWISDHELLIVYTDHEAGTEESETGTLDTGNWKGHAEILDAVTGKVTPQPKLSDRLNHLPLDKSYGPITMPREFHLSPKGTWLLWETSNYGDGWPIPFAAHLDGTHCRSWDRARFEPSFFLDERHYVQVAAHDPFLSIRDLEDPSRDRTFHDTAGANAELLRMAVRQPTYFADPICLSDTHQAQFNTYRTQDRLRDIRAVGSEQAEESKPVSNVTLKLPTDTECVAAEVSPQLQLVCFHLRGLQIDPLTSLLHRLFNRVPIRMRGFEALWVSRIDGSELHEIGHVASQSTGDEPCVISELSWLPGGKQISFRMSEKIRTVSADK